MTITANLKYSWRIRHGKTKAILREFGEASGAVDFKDDELKLNEHKQVEGKSVQQLTTGLARALCAEVIQKSSEDAALKEAITMVGWKVDVYKLDILSIDVG